MKRIINSLMVLLAASIFVACENDDKDFFDKNPPVVELKTANIASVNFNQTIKVEGTASSPNAIRDVSFYLAKKTGDKYERLWFSPLQYGNIAITKEVNFSADVKIDDPEANAIAVSVSDPYGNNLISYITIGKIEGSPSGSAFVSRDVEMKAEYEYGMTQPYIFSLDGVAVSGTKKHILSLNEIKSNPSTNLHFALINIWRNTTTYSAGVLGNWGYGFCEFRQLNRGPVGRQCDYLALTGKNEIPAGVDTCSLIQVSSAVASVNNFDQIMELAGNNFGTYNFLNQLASLFKTDYSQYVVNFKTAAASTTATGINTTACVESVTKGSYVAFRVMKKGVPYYGLIQITGVADATSILAQGGGGKFMPEAYANNEISNANLPQKWFDSAQVPSQGIAKLFGQGIKMNIISQQK